MGLLKWLKSILGSVDLPPHDYVDSALLFPELDVERMRKRMRLAEEGQDRGSRDEPPTDHDSFDEIENRIINEIQSELRRSYEKAASHLRAYSERLASLKIETHVSQLSALPGEARTNFWIATEGGRDLLFQLRQDVKAIKAEYEQFRKDHGLSRMAHFPTSLKWHVAIICFLVLIEAILNGFLLARGLEFGLLGGVVYAFIIASFNVAFGLVAGRFAFTNVVHRRSARRVAAFVGLSVWICVALLFNLGVAHYRAALGGDNPEQAEKTAISQLADRPLYLPEVSGWLLLFLGISFSVLAAVDGWKMDDPYPGYGHLTRKLNEINQDYTDRKGLLLAELQQIRDDATKRMNALAGEVEVLADQFKNIQQSRLQLVAKFQKYVEHLEQSGNALLSAYRHANRSARKTAPPEHFREDWRIQQVPELAVDSFSGLTFQQRLDDALKNLPAGRRQVEEDFASAVSVYESLEELSELEAVGGDPFHQGRP
ncbi:MAG TPA: hypothetical protein V6D17_23475 [Candidatus Obscuribacterales bacterium]